MFFVIFKESFKIKLKVLKMRDRTNYNMLLGNDRFRMFYFLLCLGGKLQASLLKMTQADTELLGAILVYSPLKKKKKSCILLVSS